MRRDLREYEGGDEEVAGVVEEQQQEEMWLLQVIHSVLLVCRPKRVEIELSLDSFFFPFLYLSF